MTRGVFKGWIAAASFMLAFAPAQAADFSIADETYPAESGQSYGGWDIRVTPYAWLLGISGDLNARGRSANLDLSFAKIVEDSDYLIPLMGYVQARHGPLTLFGEAMYTQVEFSGVRKLKRQLSAGPELTVGASYDLTQTLSFYEAGVSYEVGRWENPIGPTRFEILGGGRYWYVDTDASLNAKATLRLKQLNLQQQRKFAAASSGSLDWIDPVVGLRIFQEIAPGQELQFMGDLGGFGVGSQFTWQLYGGYSHVLKTGKLSIAGTAGYRILGVDYQAGSGNSAKGFDIVLQGAIAGLSFRW